MKKSGRFNSQISTQHSRDSSNSDVTLPTDMEDEANMGSPENPLELDQPLNDKWQLWLIKYDQNKSWEENSVCLAHVNTLRHFWWMLNHMRPLQKWNISADVAFFRRGILPMWEDAQNRGGGSLVIFQMDRQHRGDLEPYWLELLLMLVSVSMARGEEAETNAAENADETATETGGDATADTSGTSGTAATGGLSFLPADRAQHITGTVINLRRKIDRLNLWMRPCADEVLRDVGETVRRCLKLDATHDIKYQRHSDAQNKTSSVPKTTLHV